MVTPFDDEYFMREALRLATAAFEDNEIPVGAVVVTENNQIIGKGYNQTEKLNDSSAHAEMIAITSAFHHLGAKYLQDCRLYVTLEPCAMCAGAIHWAQISTLIFGAPDKKKGYTLFSSSSGKSILHESTTARGGVLAQECSELVSTFFKQIREKQ